MQDRPQGKYFVGFVSNDDFTTEQVVSMTDGNGNAVTLNPGERPLIDEMIVSNGATARKFSVFTSTDGTLNNGNLLFSVNLIANQSIAFPAAGNASIYGLSAKTTDAAFLVQSTGASVGGSVVIIGRVIKS